MKPTSAFLAAAAFLALCASRLDAGDAPAPDDPKARGQAFAAGRKAFDPSLAGTQWFATTLEGRRRLGAAKITVEKAPEGSGAAYRLVADVRMTFGGKAFRSGGDVLFDPSFALVSAASEDERDGKKSVILTRKGPEGWTWEKSAAEPGAAEPKVAKLSVPDQGPNHGEGMSFVLFARAVPLDVSGTYALSGIRWSDPDKKGEAGRASAYVDLKLTVPAPAAFAFRGKEVQAFLLRFEKGGDATIVAVDASHRILSFWSENREGGIDVRFVAAADEEEAGKDVARGTKDLPGADTPRAAVEAYFRVLSKVDDPDALDGIMDWKSVREAMAGANAEVASMDDDLFGATLKSQLRNRPAGMPPAMVEKILPGITEEVDGESATLRVPVGPRAVLVFKLKAAGGKWKILQMPARG
ncbi:MAG: hypothetical protein MUC63_00400 [Planctomycetes bacterium]|jgi:hypothetical protein|nr:hypothetical protein [Planctomycetota bacterium]